jgi:hypothetical protein
MPSIYLCITCKVQERNHPKLCAYTTLHTYVYNTMCFAISLIRLQQEFQQTLKYKFIIHIDKAERQRLQNPCAPSIEYLSVSK